MSMKRKRSTGSLFQTATLEASSPTPFASSPIRLPNFFVQSKTHDPQSSPFTPKSYHHESSQLEENTSHTLNSRTRKRYRDARPEESQIHASTVEKLFHAQKAHPHASPQPSQQPQPQLQAQYPLQFPPQDAPPQRSTLHSFWHLPQPSHIPQQHTDTSISQQEVLACEGCDGRLIPEYPYGMDTLDADTMCTACGKHVCNTCAITADTRLCLDCAMQA
ncbi:hypothetical protein M436DRAFT_53122 [Aureobasidium namibiae CBS 147.97]|uniref:Uncharacterized protein n=1 Tax=Aureobasidium namibiae CBS 147.97 TaxID=1043004 RepID=A0A074WGH3_9PEZI